MGFFYHEAKAEAKANKRPAARTRDIPIQSLNQLGCSVCPRDKDRDLRTPKMEPSGASAPILYVLSAAPSLRDDDTGSWLTDKAGREIMRMLPRDADRYTRMGGVIQCATDTVSVGQHETECCRSRVVRDIEESQPLVILGVGDAPPRGRGRHQTIRSLFPWFQRS